MKKLVTVMVAVATLTMSLSAAHVCDNVPSIEQYKSNNQVFKIFNTNIKNILNDYLISQSNKGASQKTGQAYAMTQLVKEAGVSRELEISTSSGLKRSFDLTALVHDRDNYINHLLKNYSNDDYMFSKFFVSTTKLPSFFYNIQEPERLEHRPFSSQLIYLILHKDKAIESWLNALYFVTHAVISDNRLSHFNLDYQDFLYAILTQDYKTADKIISSVVLEKEDGMSLFTSCDVFRKNQKRGN